VVGQLPADLFHGGPDQFGDAAEPDLGGSDLSRLVIVSNRVAVSDDPKAKAGGLAVALQDALQRSGGVWFGWSGKTTGRTSNQPNIKQAGPVTYATMDLSRQDCAEYYNGFANRTLWPLFHYRIDL